MPISIQEVSHFLYGRSFYAHHPLALDFDYLAPVFKGLDNDVTIYTAEYMYTLNSIL